MTYYILLRNVMQFGSGVTRGTIEAEAYYDNTLVMDVVLDVSCLSVDGTRAWVGATIVRSNDPSLLGLDTVFRFLDLVDRGNEGYDYDRVAVFDDAEYEASDCAHQPLDDAPLPLLSGDYTVW